MVDTADSKSANASCGGSSPPAGTTHILRASRAFFTPFKKTSKSNFNYILTTSNQPNFYLYSLNYLSTFSLKHLPKHQILIFIAI